MSKLYELEEIKTVNFQFLTFIKYRTRQIASGKIDFS